VVALSLHPGCRRAGDGCLALIGVLAGGRLRESSELLVWVRAVATALVAGVISRLILFPAGALADAPLALRLAAAVLGWLAFWAANKRILVGVLTAEAVLIGGWLALV